MQNQYDEIKDLPRFTNLCVRAWFIRENGTGLSYDDACELHRIMCEPAPTLPDYITVDKIAARVGCVAYSGEWRA
jgi:hypothetical protein